MHFVRNLAQRRLECFQNALVFRFVLAKRVQVTFFVSEAVVNDVANDVGVLRSQSQSTQRSLVRLGAP